MGQSAGVFEACHRALARATAFAAGGLVALTLLLALPCAADAGYPFISTGDGAWYWQNPRPQANALNDLCFRSPDRGWAVGDYGTVIWTSDGGETWTAQKTNVKKALLTIDFCDSSNGLIGGDGVLLTTSNAGQDWIERPMGPIAAITDVDCVDRWHSWFVAGREIYASADGGTTWTRQHELGDVSDTLKSLSFSDSLHGWAVGSAYDGSGRHSLILTTSDGGASWTEQDYHGSSWLNGVKFVDSTHGWAVGNGGIVVTTQDGGETWTEQTVGTTDPLLVVEFVDRLHGWTTGAVQLQSYADLYRTTDGGKSWARVGSSYRAIDFSDANHGFAVDSGGHCAESTADGGEDWGYVPSSGNIRAWDICDVFFIDASHGWAVENNGNVLLRTYDGGLTWRNAWRFGGPDGHQYVWLHALFFTDREHGWAVGADGRICVTSDGGYSWMPQRMYSPGSAGLNDVAFSDTTHGWAVGNDGTILCTLDGGGTWSAQASGTSATLNGVAFADRQHGIAVGDGTILRTTDGGVSWSEVDSGSTFFLNAVAMPDWNHTWAVGNSGAVLFSGDGGTTWSRQASGTWEELTDVSFPDAVHGWAVGSADWWPTMGSEHSVLIATRNAGATWEPQEPGTDIGLSAVSFPDPMHGWISAFPNGGGGILATDTGGWPAFTISPSAGQNGSISPATPQTAPGGSSISFTITPNAGYRVADVVIDGLSLGSRTTWQFTDISANHTIRATFAAKSATNLKPVIVCISGLCSNTYPYGSGAHDWDYVKAALENIGYEVHVAFTRENGESPYIDSRSGVWDYSAACLARQLNDFRLHGRDVILIGHSMGGLIARAYAENWTNLAAKCKPVAIIQLGTPNKGSPMAPWGNRLHVSTCQATRALGNATYMADFNASHPNHNNVPIYRLAGTYMPWGDTGWASASFLWPTVHADDAIFHGESNDLAVAASSVAGGPPRGAAGYAQFPAVHNWSKLCSPFLTLADAGAVLPYNRTGADQYQSTGVARDSDIMDQISRWVLRATSRNGSAGGTSSPAGGIGAAASSGAGISVMSTSEAMDAAPGSTASCDRTLSLDSGPASASFIVEEGPCLIMVSPDAGTVDLSLTDATGTSVPLDPSTEDGSSQAQFELSTPGGQYTLTVSAASGSPTEAEVEVIDCGVSSLRVLAPDQTAVGEPFAVRAAVYERNGAATPVTFTRSTEALTVTVRLDDGTAEPMRDDGTGADDLAGDGIYSSALTAPAAGSRGVLHVQAQGANSSSTPFMRVAETSVALVTPRAGLSGSYAYRLETDSADKVTALFLDVGVTATQDCCLALHADVSSDGAVAAAPYAMATLTAGQTQTITLRVPAEDLYPGLAADGSFALSRVALTDTTNTDLTLLEQAQDVLSGTLDKSSLDYSECSVRLVGANPSPSGDVLLEGSAIAAGTTVAGVDYSLDGGLTWQPVSAPAGGWSDTWQLPLSLENGEWAVLVRAVDDSSTPIEGAHGYVTFSVKVPDTAAPVTAAAVAPLPNAAGWGNSSATVTLDATDEGSGVAKIFYRIGDTGAYAEYDPAAKPLISTSGVHTLWYYASDTAGNDEDARSITVSIDKTKPVTKALYNASVYRGRKVTLRLRVNDTISPKASVTVKIYRGRVLKKSLKLALRKTNTGIRYSGYTCWLARGSYTWKVYATDLAGNPQKLPVGYRTLTVR